MEICLNNMEEVVISSLSQLHIPLIIIAIQSELTVLELHEITMLEQPKFGK